jgi:hypothetical protein
VRAASVRRRSFRVAIAGLAALSGKCTDGGRLEDGNEHREAQRSDAERNETQNFFILAPMHFPVRAERVRHLKDLPAIWGQVDLRGTKSKI